MNIIDNIWYNKNYKVAKRFLTIISERQKEARTKDSYQTIITDYANRCFETALKRLLEEGNAFYLDYYYKTFTNIDDTGYLSRETGEYLEQFMKNGMQLRMVKFNDLPKSEEELSTSSSVVTALETGVTTDAITELRNFPRLCDGVQMATQLKASWTPEQSAILLALPDKYIEGDSVPRRFLDKIYDITENNRLTIKPEYILGMAITQDGKCTFYDKKILESKTEYTRTK